MLPPHGRRILAKLIDVVLIVFMFAALVIPAATLTAFNIGEEFVWIALCLSTIASAILASLYTVIREWRYGYTVGKYLNGLRVVRESGARISFGQSVVRQLPVFVQAAGSMRCSRCSPTGGSARSSCCRRRAPSRRTNRPHSSPPLRANPSASMAAPRAPAVSPLGMM